MLQLWAQPSSCLGRQGQLQVPPLPALLGSRAHILAPFMGGVPTSPELPMIPKSFFLSQGGAKAAAQGYGGLDGEELPISSWAGAVT